MDFVERKSDLFIKIVARRSPFRGAVDQISRNQRPQFKTFHSYTYGKIFAPKHLSQASFCVFRSTTRCLPQKIGNPYNNLLVNFNQAKKFNDSDEIKRNLPEMEGFSQVCWFMDSDAVQSSVWVWSPSQASGEGAGQLRNLILKPFPHEHDEGSLSIQSPHSDHTAEGVRTGKTLWV